MFNGYLNIIFFCLILTILGLALGKYIAVIFKTPKPILVKLETPLYKLMGIDSKLEQNWWQYALSLILFNLLGIVLVFLIQVFQQYLMLNPEHLANLSWDLALNTAISFVGNTNWQAYAGESTMSYFSQMVALGSQNFLSAATGITVVIALIRGFTRHNIHQIGNFWVDLTKTTLYVLLPLSVILAVLLISQGVVQNFNSYTKVKLLEPQTVTQTINSKAITSTITTQTIPQGPVASQEAIKMLGTNGGGFFNANSAHPYENPTPISNFLEMLAILLIPAALCFSFGYLLKDKAQGYTIYLTMLIVFIVFAIFAMYAESQTNPLLHQLQFNGVHPLLQGGGNLEGKETRFGIFGSSLFATVTTAASCGAVNATHDSLMPLGGLVPLFLMQMSEVIFGGVGSGLYGILAFAILAVFICGLMIGRTPEYLGKKIESYEMKMVAIIILITPFLVLVGTAISVVVSAGVSSMANPGAHGFSEVLYAFTSSANNNGSAFAGLNANTVYYNLSLGAAIFIGRFGVIISILAIAGSLANKKKLPITAGSMPTTGLLFILILIGTIIIVGALTYIPSLALGPIVEHLLLFK